MTLFLLAATMLLSLVCPMNGVSIAGNRHYNHSGCSGDKLMLSTASSDCHGSHFGALQNFLGTMPDLSLLSVFFVTLFTVFSIIVAEVRVINRNFFVKWRHLYLEYLDSIKTEYNRQFQYWLNQKSSFVLAN